ncbi:MAG: hypothetical protein P1U56_16185 [Saprospiraceae bacterium]|nr:hypothetical protein [Saprospiraceae bacterium]
MQINQISKVTSLKTLPLLLLLFVSLIVFSCKTSKLTGETMLIEPSPSGQLYVLAGGYGNMKEASVNNAIQNAFMNILLQGIPESNQSTPLLGNNAQDVYASNRGFFDKLFENDIERFILDKKVSNFKFLNLNEPSTNVKLKINLNAFRSHLEQKGIIRAFGL